MPHILDFVEANRLRKILHQYAEAFNASIFVFDANKEVFFKNPEEAAPGELSMRPLSVRDSIVGYIAVPASESQKLDFITENLSEIVQMGYEVQSLSGEVARNYEELSLLWRLSSRLGVGLNVDKICSVLADETMNLCPSKSVSVLLLSEMPEETLTSSHLSGSGDPSYRQVKETFFFPKVSLGAYAVRASKMVFNAERGLLGQAFKKKEPITVCDVGTDERFEGFPFPVTRILIIPLTVEDSVIGAIVATDKLNGEEYYSTEIKLISSIASECAMSIKKAILFEEIRGTLFSIAEAFSLAIDAKDSYTYGHSKRVSEIAVGIAKEMDFPSDAISLIRLAALLHDIGKIGTPENILHKNDKLSSDEMDRIKEHPLTGRKMIEHIRRMKEIAQWISHHHERFDGSGYPSGLKGHEIPLASRIIAIADCFDALTSERPYRKVYSKEEAIEIMKGALGTQLDPAVFDCFIKTVA